MSVVESTIVILGAGGHARMLAQFLAVGGHRVRGYVSPRQDACHVNEWLGEDEDLTSILTEGTRVINGIGSTGRISARRRAFEIAHSRGAHFLDYLHPDSLVDPSSQFGPGVQVLAGAILQPASALGRNVLINTAALVEHDVCIGDHAHVAPRACLCGGVKLGCGVHVGAGAIVLQNLQVGDDAVIGAGAVVTRAVPAGATVVGNPARIVEQSAK